MTRRLLVTLLVLFVLCVSVVAATEPPSYVKLTLLSTNDIHCRLTPFDDKGKSVGGYARKARYANQLKAQSNWPVLLLDSGDTTYWWDSLSKAFHGLTDIDVMNEMGYVAMEPGNHEFEWPSAYTLANLKASKFPWICANLVDEKTGRLFLTPYVIREYGGVKIAFFGLITQMVNDPPYKARQELGLKQIDPIAVAKKLLPELRKQADIVILLSHLGVYQDPKVAQAVPGIDVILGGHSHTRLATPTMIPVGTPTANWTGTVPMVQAGCYGGEIGRTDVIFHRDPTTGRYALMSCKGQLVAMDSSIGDDPVIAGVLRTWEAKLKAASAAAPAPNAK